MLKQLTEEYYGDEIADDEWRQAKADSEVKLQRIIERQGDADGERTEPWYLAMLIAEEIRATRIMYETMVQNRQKKSPQPEL